MRVLHDHFFHRAKVGSTCLTDQTMQLTVVLSSIIKSLYHVQTCRHKATLHALLTSCLRYRHIAAATALPTVCQALYLSHLSGPLWCAAGALQGRARRWVQCPCFQRQFAQASRCTTKQDYTQQDTLHGLPSGLQRLLFPHTQRLRNADQPLPLWATCIL